VENWDISTPRVFDSAYLDVYNSHVGSVQTIWEKRNGAFHTMMVDIFTQASSGMAIGLATVPIAQFDLDNLED